MWYNLLLFLYLFFAIVIVFTVLVHGAKPSKTLAWLLAIFTVPVGGIFFYLVLGRNRRKNKLLQLKKETFWDLPKPNNKDMSFLDGEYKKLMVLVYNNSHFSPTTNNQLQLLKDGETTFNAIFKALEEAKKQIHLQYYIFEDGELANRLLLLFKQKIDKGVAVRMIYDGIGSFSLSKAYLKKLETIGVEVFPFLPFKFGRFISSLNYRNHRKIIVVDNQIAFTGGINISDKYLKGDIDMGNWHDMHIRIQGEAAIHLGYIFEMDWYLVSQKRIQPLILPKLPDIGNNNRLVQIISGGPDDDFSSMEQAYFTIINNAKKYLYITNPYIIPGQAIMQALRTAARSGVDVRLLVSEKIDSKIVHWSVRSYFETLLKAGIKIHLFCDGFLHSKIIISDDRISTIGTANLDDRSFEQNYEVNAIIYDTPFTELLREDFLKDCNKSRELSYKEYVQRPWIDKLKEGFGKIFSPLL